MVASRGLCTGQADMVLKASDAGIRPNVVQLAGRKPDWMAEAARIVIDAGADVVDINMGCPARKVTSGYSGSALMREPWLARALIEATVSCGAAIGNVPVTLKMRLGWDDETLNAPEIARMASDCGVGLITVHGRTRCQFYKGQADWRARWQGCRGRRSACDRQWRHRRCPICTFSPGAIGCARCDGWPRCLWAPLV
jgi:tRNA-dihydrouridine synthase B